ncbi:MAG: 4Fe-4S cluster-binding domain-containing protein, partial [Armatimonadia bacterium]
MNAQIHSIETLGALDGPGLRTVVFFQGCPLRCAYCHNPDTWAAQGTEMTADEIIARVQRSRPYFGRNGGVTLSGGEPLAQPQFAAELLRRCRDLGIHTAVDTSGACLNDAVKEALQHADLVILDLKHTEPDAYNALTGGSPEQ